MLDAVVVAAGTGGTLAGLATYLRSQKPGERPRAPGRVWAARFSRPRLAPHCPRPLVADLQVWLIDPPGSSLFSRVTRGTMDPLPGTT